jgi:chorismate mutase
MVRALRGATTVDKNDGQMILDATAELLKLMVSANEIDKKDIISVVFTMTADLNAAFPAAAARQLGWNDIALLDAVQADVAGSLKKCIRVLMHFNTEKSNGELRYIYLNEAKKLRPDISEFI